VTESVEGRGEGQVSRVEGKDGFEVSGFRCQICASARSHKELAQSRKAHQGKSALNRTCSLA